MVLYQTANDLQYTSNGNTVSREKRHEMINDSMRYVLDLSGVKVSAKRGRKLTYDVERDYERWIDLGEKWASKYLVLDYLVYKDNGFVFISKDINSPADNSWFTSRGGSTMFGKYGTRFGYVDTKGRVHNVGGSMHDYGHKMSIERNIIEVQKIVFDENTKLQNVSSFREHRQPNIPPPPSENISTIVYPYKKNPNAKWLDNIRYTYFDGYSKVKDFYQDILHSENYIPDRSEHLRTLYWNPNIQTDVYGNATVSFYNSYFCRQIEISAEGITNDGVPFSNK
jgi:hypothetical protein